MRQRLHAETLIAMIAGAPALGVGATLPIPCGSCVTAAGAAVNGFVQSGQASAVVSGSKLTVTQGTPSTELNWQSFNISADGSVQFVQPSASAVALNRIYQGSPSQIFGALSANGRVYLINQNGIVFGAGAQVSVGSLLASTLDIDPSALSGGLVAPGLSGHPTFQQFVDSNGVPLPSGNVSVQAGATIQSAQGGQILIFAPQITNQGTLSSPGGQSLLGAGNAVYLASSTDPTLRGLLIEVAGDGSITNGTAGNSAVADPSQLVGQIAAEDGNVTLAAMAVNQSGRVSATTSVNVNGSIRLQARSEPSQGSSAVSGGTLVLGTGSSTEVTLDTSDPTTEVDSVAQPKSLIQMYGDSIDMQSGSAARATGGGIDVDAALNQGTPLQFQTSVQYQPDGSRFYMAPGAELDVSGASVVLPASSNVIAVQLRGTELADSPLQRNGPLRGQTVYVDIRTGTPLADVSGEIAAIGRTVAERNLDGGTISIQSQGDALLAPGALIDVAGGAIHYTAGYLNTTELLTTSGQIVNIGSASPDVSYAGIVNTTQFSDPKWGISITSTVTPGNFQPAYVEGKDAGTLNLIAPSFILDANVNGSTTVGAYQRLPDQPVTTGIYRSYDQVPDGATLDIGSNGTAAGSDLIVGNVDVADVQVLPTLQNADGSAFDPLSDPLPVSYGASILRPELIGADAFTTVNVHTNGEFTLPAGTDLKFPVGGGLGIYASRIDLEGSVDAPGGAIQALAESTINPDPAGILLNVGAASQLTAQGAWVNDSVVLNPSGPTLPLFINGGTVSLTAEQADLQLATGSLIDVSGGGQLTAGGKLVAGVGGTIDLAAATPLDSFGGLLPELSLGATLRGYGIYQGGTLSIGASSVCIATADCSGGEPGLLWLAPSTFSSGGFGDYQVAAEQGALSVAPATTLTLQQQNFQLPTRVGSLASAPSLEGLVGYQVLPVQTRQPVDLSLSQTMPASGFAAGTTDTILTVTPATPSLLIGTGAAIDADPEAQLSLSSNTRIIVDGTLSAPGGSIALTLNADLPELQYEPTQAIWLGTQGVLDAQGVAQIQSTDTAARTGSVLPGGTVDISAQRGSIELLPGSLIDVAGTQSILDIAPAGGGVTRVEQIGSAGGSIELTAAENIVMGGTLEAAAGVSGAGAGQPLGGSLGVTLAPNGRSDLAPEIGLASTFSQVPRQIDVSASVPPLIVALGSAVPDWLAGIAYVPADALPADGFDSISLQAQPINTGSGFKTGSIDFAGSAKLSAGYSITLDAGNYVVGPDATAQISAPYIEFGNSDQNEYQLNTPTGGTGALDVTGSFIELFGNASLQGVGSAQFDASGDLRLRGVTNLSGQNTGQAVPSTTIGGGLFADGDITLTATQIYPTTLSQFVISADPGSVASPSSGSILVQAGATPSEDLLSAGGGITLSAGTVTQNGVLRAPFGSITIDANSMALGAGSLTSTSANGLTIPFGTTQGGFDWVNTFPGLGTVVYGTDGVAPPAQRVTLNGAQVDLNSGAVIDVSGGGDLQAYEWIQGPGGTQDVLSASQSPGLYAILPTLSLNIAPYDPVESLDSPLQVGDAVYLSASPGVAAGTYVLLPARYALLPGAFVVSAVSGTQYQDMQLGQSVAAPSGGTIVAGYRTVEGLPVADARTGGFDVVPASVVMQQAQYNLTSANSFFASQAASAGVSPPALPADSGALELIASDTLTLDATLRAQPGSDGRGASVDIASADILVTGDAGATASPGQLLLTTASLDQFGAQSLLLGGERDGDTITTAAQDVVIASGATLTAPQVLLTAQQQVTVSGGATVAAMGAATGAAPQATSYQLSGDGAFLGVSAGPQITLTRSGAADQTGILTVAPGATVSVNQGSVYLDATQNVAVGGTLDIAGGDLAVQSSEIALGQAPASYAGTDLAADVLASSGLRNLSLTSSSSIDFYGGVNASAQNVTLDAPNLSGYGGSSDVAALSASDTLTLTNTSGLLPDPTSAASGSGALALTAAHIAIGDGAVGLAGFQSTTLAAQDEVMGIGAATLSQAGGGLSVIASRITTAAGASLALSADGAMTMQAPGSPAMLPTSTDLGGTLTVTAANIELGTQIDLPSGQVTLQSVGPSTSGIVLDPGAQIGVGGLVTDFAGASVPSPGGSVRLVSASNMSLASGSSIDVSSDGGAGGSLTLSATAGSIGLDGSLSGTAAMGQGATFSIDAQSFGDFTALNQALNAGGFNGGRSFRLRGPGDLAVAAGADNAVTATNVTLEADQGGISVLGTIDASGGAGGNVLLAAADDVVVDGSIDAHANAAGGSGGTVELDTTGGAVLINAGSVIDVAGGGTAADGAAGSGGTVLLRVPQGTVAALLSGGSGVSLAGNIQGASRTTLEAYAKYEDDTGTLDAAQLDPSTSTWFSDAQTFMGADNANALAITSLLGRGADPSFVVEPGIEIDSTGSLELDTPWNLYTWRFTDATGGSVPGILTLRAQGGVTINSALSDGFTATSGTGAFSLPSTPSDSWSYRIIAGADLSAANPLAVSSSSPANVTITASPVTSTTAFNYAPNMVRTGDGFIDVAASGDLVLGNQASLLYTAGVAGPGLTITQLHGGGLRGQAYPTDGGDIRVDVGGDVLGAVSNQFINSWLWRMGGSGRPVAWTVDFQSFQQGVAALGGGDVSVVAGGNVENLSVSIPSIGRQVGCTTAFTCSVVQVGGGGQLAVSAGGSIEGGSFYTGMGNLTLRAGADIGAVPVSAGGTGIAPLLGLGAGSASVTAQNGLQLAGIVNPSLLPTGTTQGNVSSYFSTYAANSSVSLTAISGDIVLPDQNTDLLNALRPSFSNLAFDDDTSGAPVGFDVLPPTLTAYALGGDIDISRLLVLSPAASGNLQLFANGSVIGSQNGGSSMQVIVSDADPTLLPSVSAPQIDMQDYLDIANAFGQSLADQHAASPVHEPAAGSAASPVRIVALNGDVVLQPSVGGEVSGFWTAQPAQIVAGQDIVDLNLIAQNLTSADVTSVSAGRDITYPQSRTPSGTIEGDVNQITVDGPGELQLTAGRDVNLGTSAGVTTRGNLVNPALAPGGASASIEAGVGAGAPQYAQFISQYIDGSNEFDDQLVGFVETITGTGGLSAAQARQIFDGMSATLQRTFVEQVFFDLLRLYGRQEAASGNGDFSGAFAAIATLFPGANPNLALGQSNPYVGNIELYFSRAYTLDGGSISLLAPGGEINVGLALAPSSYGISKGAAQLGVVAQAAGDVNAFAYNDFEVNQSRVFAADGGNILVWSTEGNIDAGRGAKTAISAPPPTITTDPLTGQLIVSFSSALEGSGIQAIATTPGVSPGDVDLFAPHGVVNANDAGIVAGNLTIAATAVLGTNNISVSGTEVGVPVAVTGLGASFAGASSAAGATSNVAEGTSGQAGASQSQTPLSQAEISFLQVFVTGLGEANCAPDDLACLRRESQAAQPQNPKAPQAPQTPQVPRAQ